MFSILPNMVDSTMEELIEDIPLSYEIKKALIDEEGLGGELLKLVKAYERADWKTTHKISTELKIPVELLSNTYIDCICEVNSIWDNLVSELNKDDSASKIQDAKILASENLEEIIDDQEESVVEDVEPVAETVLEEESESAEDSKDTSNE